MSSFHNYKITKNSVWFPGNSQNQQSGCAPALIHNHFIFNCKQINWTHAQG